jgi:mono/diheme cytochrome c family protein
MGTAGVAAGAVQYLGNCNACRHDDRRAREVSMAPRMRDLVGAGLLALVLIALVVALVVASFPS